MTTAPQRPARPRSAARRARSQLPRSRSARHRRAPHRRRRDAHPAPGTTREGSGRRDRPHPQRTAGHVGDQPSLPHATHARDARYECSQGCGPAAQRDDERSVPAYHRQRPLRSADRRTRSGCRSSRQRRWRRPTTTPTWSPMAAPQMVAAVTAHSGTRHVHQPRHGSHTARSPDHRSSFADGPISCRGSVTGPVAAWRACRPPPLWATVIVVGDDTCLRIAGWRATRSRWRWTEPRRGRPAHRYGGYCRWRLWTPRTPVHSHRAVSSPGRDAVTNGWRRRGSDPGCRDGGGRGRAWR